MKKLLFLGAIIVSLVACKDLNSVVNDVNKQLGTTTTGNKPLTNGEVISGLREALNQGTNKSTGAASAVDGFYKNARLFIPFPPEAQKVKDWAVKLGMTDQVNKFEMTLNRAAETAAKDAAPIFLDAIKNMSISDGFAILKGNDTAATHYLRNATTAQLVTKFKPVVQSAIQKVEVTKYWNPIITKYNMVPGVEKKNPNLDDYVTQRALNGLFTLIKDEESNIRKNPAARVTDILKRVFGQQN